MSNQLAEVSTLYALRFTRNLDEPVERVWHAITDERELAAWMGYPARLDLRVGGAVRLCADSDDGEAIAGIVTVLEPPHVLRYTWDMALIQWSLSATPGGCRLELVHHGITDARRVTEFGSGWQEFLECLERYLEGRGLAADAQRRARVTELEEAYRALMAARH
jgi:uncharacterized protein YndB with AHSA1/START domain